MNIAPAATALQAGGARPDLAGAHASSPRDETHGALPDSQESKRSMALTGAGMFAGAALLNLVESLTPEQSRMPFAPSAADLVISVLLLLFGRRLAKPALFLLGPIGVALVAYAMARTKGSADCAVTYAWPMLWTAHFFGRRATAALVAAIGAADGLALHVMPSSSSDISRWVEVMISITVVAVVVRALTEKNQRLLRRLADEALTDPLTGLLNRRGLHERAAAELARAQREQIPVSVIALDIDHFKLINDRHGHETDDNVLELVGSMLREQIRSSEIIARVGGEEFLILLSGCDEDHAVAVAERVRLQAARLAILGVPEVTLSAGVATTTTRVELESLTVEADSALYVAKRDGRNRTVLASPKSPSPTPAFGTQESLIAGSR